MRQRIAVLGHVRPRRFVDDEAPSAARLICKAPVMYAWCTRPSRIGVAKKYLFAADILHDWPTGLRVRQPTPVWFWCRLALRLHELRLRPTSTQSRARSTAARSWRP